MIVIGTPAEIADLLMGLGTCGPAQTAGACTFHDDTTKRCTYDGECPHLENDDVRCSVKARLIKRSTAFLARACTIDDMRGWSE